jgi:REP element-mobilizing transposase RayT
MARPLRIEYGGAFYHVTSRGNERKDVFKSARDREKFLSYLESAGERYGAVIHAYCLMDNHYHLLLETPSGNLSQIMRHINGAYTTYFNTKRRRSGHLFQGRFKGILVEADEYAKELSRYIHLNPVRAGVVETPEAYGWSSYAGYIGAKEPPAWLARDFILGSFGRKVAEAQRRYRGFVEAGLKDRTSPLSKVVGSMILGSDEFIQAVIDKYLKHRTVGRDVPAVRELATRATGEDIVRAVDKAFKKEPATARKVALYLCHRYTSERLKEIGVRFGMSEAGVSKASRRLSLAMKRDAGLRKRIHAVRDVLGLSNV